jgi:NAD(P)-dependent dehydrogenase (short-subunit alcohol dehydrogenase family)
MVLDLSDLATVKPAVEEFLKQETRLDVLFNNAAVMMPPRGSTDKQVSVQPCMIRI